MVPAVIPAKEALFSADAEMPTGHFQPLPLKAIISVVPGFISRCVVGRECTVSACRSGKLSDASRATRRLQAQNTAGTRIRRVARREIAPLTTPYDVVTPSQMLLDFLRQRTTGMKLIDHNTQAKDDWRAGVTTRMRVSAQTGSMQLCIFDQW